MRFFLLLVTVTPVLSLNAQAQSKPTITRIEAVARIMSPEQLEVALPRLESIESVVAWKTMILGREHSFHCGNVNKITLKDNSIDGYAFGVQVVRRGASTNLVSAMLTHHAGRP